ncbi:CHASE2 domain-containing protein [Spirulina sp. CS-785/01]|uniref:CHASE2 domain-containing protein n=1 Tax=Spirulina sp. CS-785/01 TaxID=3021716 RepID=UPI00232C3B8A|nr:CHASE2 domain-containing protein [Spirulina sp. CS-785/01]MDB9313635.1 CHASE2 domain-containing protein [Spirulina sp. CS-785/01]
MIKIVQFKIGAGDFERGFLVSLRIQVNHQPDIEIDGELPPAPEIPQLYRDWQAAYGTQGMGVYRALEVVEEEVTHISVQDSAKALEVRLNDWLNGADGRFRPVREGLLSYLQERDRIRFLIRANDNILWQLPWHLCDLFQRYPNSDIALHIAQNPFTPVNRPQQTHVRLLTILGEATDINVDADLNLLQDNLPNDAKILEPLIASRRETINNALWQQQADILFFAGHSTSRQAGRFFINETESLTIKDLKYALRQAISQGLKLAIFNSCDGLQLARDLSDLQIPAIIVMRERIPDEAAQRFLEYFLTAFAQEQKPLYTAVREARERLHGLENRYPCVSWLPVLCQHPQAEELTWPKMRQGEERVEKMPVSPPQSGFRPVSWGKRVQLGVLATVLVTGGIVGLRSLGWLQPFELWAYDQFMRLQPGEVQKDPRILLVTVDAEDIAYQDERNMERNGSISDQALLLLLDKLNQFQSPTIGLNIYRPHGLNKRLARQVQQNQHFYITCKAASVEDDNNNQGVASPSNLSPRQSGFNNFLKDGDGTVRRVLLTQQDATPCPSKFSFSSAIALDYLSRIHNIQLSSNSQEDWQWKELTIQGLTRHTSGYQGIDARGYQIMINYRAYSRPETAFHKLSLRDILENGIPERWLQEYESPIILIGTTESSYAKLFRTPYGEEIQGIFIEAQQLSQLLSAVLEGRTLIWSWSQWIEIIWIFVWSTVGVVLTLLIRYPRFLRLAQGVTVILLTGVCYLLFLQGGWIPLIPAAMGIFGAEVALKLLPIPSRKIQSYPRHFAQKL